MYPADHILSVGIGGIPDDKDGAVARQVVDVCLDRGHLVLKMAVVRDGVGLDGTAPGTGRS